MRFIPLVNHNLPRDQGSSVVGFALVAPIIFVVLIASIEISMILAQRSILLSAAHTAARTSATLGSNHHQAKPIVLRVLAEHNMRCSDLSISSRLSTINGNAYVLVTLQCLAHVSWISSTVPLTASARAIDENQL